MKLAITRAIVDAIHSGQLNDAPTVADPHFGFQVVTQCPNVPNDVLVPRNMWADKTEYDTVAKKLAGLFIKNFTQYASVAGPDVVAAGPRLER